MTPQVVKNLIVWGIVIAFVVLFVHLLGTTNEKPAKIPYSKFIASVESGGVTSVEIQEGNITGTFSQTPPEPGQAGKKFTTYSPNIGDELLVLLQRKGVEVEALPPSSPMWQHILIVWAPILLIVALWIFVVRQMQAGGGKAMSFGKSRARMLTENEQRVTFEDVAGVDESKFELEEIIAFLRDPKKFTRLGGRIPKGVLLVGPPGTGKTLLARAVAGEAGVPFFSISGSDFVEMFVGVGASRVRDLFQQGKKNAPCIIFIDEIDAVGRHRGAGLGGGHDEREQTLNQLLVEMDGFEGNEGVILVAATNRPDVLDPALLRPGRFDRRVVVPRPDMRGRHAILKVHSRRVPLADDVDLEVLAKGTPGFVGADLQNLINEAALLAARRDAQRVNMSDFERAKDKVLLGVERKSMIMSEETKRTTAYHEAGHALVALYSKHSDPVHKVTIIPRGMALGVTQYLPKEEEYTRSKEQIVSTIRHALGGRAAEELVFNQLNTGAANDLKQATELARHMICTYGMSDSCGPVYYGDDQQDVFLGREFSTRRTHSQHTAQKIDDEVEALMNRLYADAKQILADHRDVLDAAAQALLERETIDAADLELLAAGKPLPPLKLPVAKDGAKDGEKDASVSPEKAGREPVSAGFAGDISNPEPMPS